MPSVPYGYEVFNVPRHYAPESDEGSTYPDGWYWWACFPGCLPDGEPIGPFETEGETIADLIAEVGEGA